MSTPFLSEIKIVAFNFAPKGWAQCNGQLLPINQNQALFSLLGTRYGGNGQTNFALPDLRDCTPIHMGGGHDEGEKAGQQAHTLTMSEMAAHIHFGSASSTTGTQVLPANNVFANSAPNFLYGPVQNLTATSPQNVTNVGGSQAHTNMMPYLVLNFCIALQGIFPTQN